MHFAGRRASAAHSLKIGDWATYDPWDWQVKEDAQFGNRFKRGVFASPRLGKTLGSALSIRRLALRGHINTGVVSAPLKVCPIWQSVLNSAGIPTHALYELSVKEIRAFLRDGKAPWDGVCIINRDKLLDTWQLFVGAQAYVADECHNYSAVMSGRGRAYRALAQAVPWARALTGTPVPKHYGSLWGQLYPMDTDRWDPIELRSPTSRVGAYKRFAQKFLVVNPQMPSQVISHINVPALQAMVLSVASVYRREDIWGKDKYQIVRRDVDMPESAWKLYHRMARESILSEFDLDAPNAGVKLMRLQQITSGCIPSSEGGEKKNVTIHESKIDMLIEDLGDIFASGEKSVIFHRFTPEGQAAVARIHRAYPHVPVWTVNGTERVSADEHYRRTEAFNAADGAAAIVVQIQSGSEGISLREGQHLAYLSRTMSFTDDEQSRDRAYTPGKLRTITYYEVPGTVDDFVSMLLADRRLLHEAIKNIDRESLAYGPIRHRRKTT